MMTTTAASLRWLSVRRHRVRGFAAPFLLILQHHLVESSTSIVAPVVPAGLEPATLLMPRLTIGGVPFRAVLLNMAAVPLRQIAAEAREAVVDEDAVTAALDAIFRGYPAGLPLG